jgi:ribonuclease E
MAEGMPPTTEGAEGDRDGARRRRRRGGRGRNRAEGAPTDAAADATDGGSDEALQGAGDMPQSIEAVQPMALVASTPEPLITAPVVVPQPVATTRPIVVPAPAAAAKAEPYALPIDRLNAVASEAGLEWVHSDNDKVRAAQAAIAAEAKPQRVPREPKPPVAIDDGPLVLVETKKDLSQIKLPFDRG